ncbi:MAG TPA: alpha/beta fold hydrolase [Gemmatimonadaceae bacterium]|nr:alpha/beta fold hydrolase [Gemmatimonadaceae bacterium]
MPTRLYQTVRSEQSVPGGRRITLEFRADAESLPAVLLLPETRAPAPGALLLHGYTSRKEHMSDTVGEALLHRGVASLAIDLPLHGERGGSIEPASVENPLDVVRRWRAALAECSLALGYLGARPEVDAGRLALVGYSLGSFLAVIVAAREPRVRAVALAAGGDLPEGTPFAKLIRAVADPLRAVRRLSGRPLLMVNGRWDRIIRPAAAERLFAEAGEPKELRWWDTGHRLSPAAIADAAEWLATMLEGGRHAASQ